MIPLFNRPIMLHIVELLKKYEITDLVMLLYHQPFHIKNFFRDGADFGVKITYVTRLQDMGTAGAVKAAEKYLDERFPGNQRRPADRFQPQEDHGFS